MSGTGPLSSTEAYVIKWAPPSNGGLSLLKDRDTVVEIKTESERTVVTSEEGDVVLPAASGPVTIVVDGPCIEICTSVGNIGLGQVVQPWQQLKIAGEAFDCSVLSR